MSLISIPNTFTVGAVIVASQHNSNFSIIYSDYNGNITDANIASNAAISDSKLSQITTASKVSGAAVTLLTSLPAGAGIIPSANLPSTTGSTVQIVNTITGAFSSGTTAIPLDDTIPQITEGTEFMTLAITPTSATNKLLIHVLACIGSGSAEVNVNGALFQDATANALATVSLSTATAGSRIENMSIIYYMTAGTTSSTTFRFRAGDNGGNTTNFNGFGGSRKFGGTMASSITISEIKV